MSQHRWVAPGGWRRAVIGFALGAAVGAAIAFVVPRDAARRGRPREP